MDRYSTAQIIERIKKACSVGKYGDNDASDFFVGATNNTERRLAEHNIEGYIESYIMDKKEYAQDVLKQLGEAGFDIGAEPGNGQDDSVKVYVYRKALFSEEDLVAKYSLTFKSSCYDENSYDKLPSTEGIYACFACTINRQSNNYHCEKLIYIGMTEKQGFNKRINQHVKNDHKSWSKHYDTKKEHLVYVIAEDNTDILQTIESALINKNETLANEEYVKHYHGEYRKITVECSGNKGILKNEITAVFGK